MCAYVKYHGGVCVLCFCRIRISQHTAYLIDPCESNKSFDDFNSLSFSFGAEESESGAGTLLTYYQYYSGQLDHLLSLSYAEVYMHQYIPDIIVYYIARVRIDCYETTIIKNAYCSRRY